MKEVENYDLIFLCNLDEISPKKLLLIEKFLYGNNKTLFVFLGTKVNTEKYPRIIAENIVRVHETPSSIKISSESQEKFKEIDEFELDKIVFEKYFILNKTNATELLSLQSAPLLIKKNFGNSRIYIFASSADMDWSNFPSKSFYPYFIQSIALEEYKTTKPPTNILTVGETIKFPYHQYAQKRTRATLVAKLPTGQYKPVKVTPAVTEKMVQFDDTELPGIYRIGDRNFAVNVSRTESNLDKIDLSKLSEYFSDSPKKVLKYSNNVSQELFAVVEGKDLATEFLLFGMILLAVEIFLSKKH